MRPLSGALWLAAYTALSLFGLFRLKTSRPGLNAGFAVGFAAYALGFLLWLRILKLLPLSVAFPMAAGALMLGTQLVGAVRLGEPLTLAKGIGVALILGGIILLRATGVPR
jgi:multidrug transporter EmrE-like cation transporter